MKNRNTFLGTLLCGSLLSLSLLLTSSNKIEASATVTANVTALNTVPGHRCTGPKDVSLKECLYVNDRDCSDTFGCKGD